MRPFDYIYYRIASLYLSTFKDKTGTALGALFVSICHIFILGLIMNSIAILSRGFNAIVFDGFLNNHNYKSWNALIALVITGFNFFRYFSIVNYDSLKAKWSLEDSETKHKKGLTIACFSILLLISVIGLAIFRQKIYY